MKYYVCMHSIFKLGYTNSDGKIVKIVYVCSTMDDAHVVMKNSKESGEWFKITLKKTKPVYDKNTTIVSYRNDESHPEMYISYNM